MILQKHHYDDADDDVRFSQRRKLHFEGGERDYHFVGGAMFK